MLLCPMGYKQDCEVIFDKDAIPYLSNTSSFSRSVETVRKNKIKMLEIKTT